MKTKKSSIKSTQPQFSKMAEIDYLIIGEITKALTLLGVRSDLLAAVGSWHDTLSPEIVLSYLRQWNKDKLSELEERISLYSTQNA